ncbi:Ig-like domain-containing protein [Brachybacterium sp. DNPG3]
MLEPTRLRRPRSVREALAVRGAALVAAALLTIGLAAPASALGEYGPFDLPLESGTVNLVPGAVSVIPLLSILDDAYQGDLDLETAQLSIPEDLTETEQGLMEVSDDGLSLSVTGEGLWSLIDDDLVFTPAEGVETPSLPIALSIDSASTGQTSTPTQIVPETLELIEVAEHSSAGEAADIDLSSLVSVPTGGSVELTLDGLTPGSAVVADGSSLTVPDEGSWQLSDDGTTLTHTPGTARLGYQLTPVRFEVQDEEGAAVAAGEAELTVPIISDLYWSAPYGEDILFSLSEQMQYIDSSTLRLQAPAGDPSEASADGTRVEIPGQGVWTLDRDAQTVLFAPEGEEVAQTAPMQVLGGDGEGADALPGVLRTAYPVMVDRALSAATGSPVVFDMTLDVRDVRSDSLVFDDGAIPEGGELSADERTLTVPGEGVWSIDLDALTATFTPEEEFTGTATPVRIDGQAVYSDNQTSAQLEAVIADVVPTARDDETSTAPGTAVTIDVLGNDTAGSAAQPLDETTMTLSSLSATNLSELSEGRGARLVIPDEGIYTVTANGSISFMPEDGFTGRTTSIDYLVRTESGVPVEASLSIEVDPTLADTGSTRADAGGINSLLVGLMPGSPGTAVVFGTIVVLMLFGGAVSLWIGVAMERDRRTWDD